MKQDEREALLKWLAIHFQEGAMINGVDITSAIHETIVILSETQHQAPQTAREVLDIIDEFLTRGVRADPYSGLRHETRKLWDVLSALRGPDDKYERKGETTVPIRIAALPELADTGEVDSVIADFVCADPTTVVVPPPHANTHFQCHIVAAAKALGLSIRYGKGL